MTFNPEDLTPGHLRAARALLGMSGDDLAKLTKLGLSTIRRAEFEEKDAEAEGKSAETGGKKGAQITRANAQLLISTLEQEGIRFLPADESGGIGVRLSD